MVSPYDLTVPGGVQSHVQQLASALRELGDEVVLLGPGAGEGYVGLGPSMGVPFNDSVAPIAPWPPTAARTVRAVRDLDPDVVHVHEPLVPWVGPAAVRAARAPIVATFHAWSTRSRAYRLARPVGRALLRRIAVPIAVSEPAAAYHAAALGVPSSRFEVVPNGVDVARYSDAEPFPEIAAAERPTLLFVGRLERRKGLEPLVRAFTRLKAELPGLRLYVIGDGPERDRCQALLPVRLRTDVVFVGRVPNDDLPRFYASCDLYIAPALGGESFGIVLLEAMAAGRAIVASDLPGYRSVARDGLQARLVPPGDVDALAEAIRSLVDNPSLRRVMGREGRANAERYDWPVVAARLRACYEHATA